MAFAMSAKNPHVGTIEDQVWLWWEVNTGLRSGVPVLFPSAVASLGGTSTAWTCSDSFGRPGLTVFMLLSRPVNLGQPQPLGDFNWAADRCVYLLFFFFYS